MDVRRSTTFSLGSPMPTATFTPSISLVEQRDTTQRYSADENSFIECIEHFKELIMEVENDVVVEDIID